MDILNKRSDLVSVVIPAYNVEDYLDDCLLSVTNQSYGQLEIIIVDDGSTDSTSQKCDEWALRDQRICVYHQSNSGLSAARNKGTQESNGGYIVYVDSDDEIGNHYIKSLLYALQSAGTLMSVTGLTQYKDEVPTSTYKDIRVQIVSGKEAIFSALMGQQIGFYACGKMFDSSLKSLLKFPEKRSYEDQATIYKLFDFAGEVAYENASDYYYRSRDTSISNSTRVNITDSYLAFKEMEDYCSDKYPDLMDPIKARKFSACAEAYFALMCTKDSLQEKYYSLLKMYANEARKNPHLKKSIKMVFCLAVLNRSVLNCALRLFSKMR